MSDPITNLAVEPVSTFKVDCAVSAKGDINVSWEVRFEFDTERYLTDQQYRSGVRMQRGNLIKELIVQSAEAKRLYQIALDDKGDAGDPLGVMAGHLTEAD